MQPSWSSSNTGVPYNAPAAETEQAFGGQMYALLERVVEVEQGLGSREWWLLGRAFPEARVLSEIGSLLAVARAELESVLARQFGYSPPPEAAAPGVVDDEMSLLNDPGWVQARQGEAAELLYRAATVLPSLQQYAQLLHSRAQQGGLAAAVVDGLGIAHDRLSEACEALQR